MTIDETTAGPVTVLTPRGDLTVQTARVFRDRIAGILTTGRNQLVIDLASVSQVDSAGLGQIVDAYRYVQAAAGTVKLARLGARVTNLMVIAKLATVFDCYPSVEEAVESFEIQV